MKKIIVAFCLLILMFLSFPALAKADLGVGIETLAILPHSLTVYYRNRDVGWGGKISGDFGVSPLSTVIKAYGGAASLGFYGCDTLNFYTLSVNKDFYNDDRMRSYLKVGAMILQGNWATSSKSSVFPNLGYGWEWDKILLGATGSIELGFPELLTLGMRHYF